MTDSGVRIKNQRQQWYSEIGLYDLRNRFYSPDIGRFLQADPSGFNGDAGNLYRYCGNNPVTRSDPSGLFVFKADGAGGGRWDGWGDRADGIMRAGDGTVLAGGFGPIAGGIDVSGYFDIEVEQANFSYSMASYATQQRFGLSGFLSAARDFGSHGLYNLVHFGTPVPRATPVSHGSVTVGRALTYGLILHVGVNGTTYAGNAEDPSKPLLTGSAGIYYDTQTGIIGYYQTSGRGDIFENGASVSLGWVQGDTNNFMSPFWNVNGTLGPATASLYANPSTGELQGGAIGVGGGLGLSDTYTTTTTTPWFTLSINVMFPYLGVPHY